MMKDIPSPSGKSLAADTLPTLSVVVPVYNTEPYVEQCLRSVLRLQRIFPLCEVIVVNDGSTDGSREIIGRLAAEAPCIRVIDQSNQGLSITRNRAIDVATGDYLWAVDSDDWIDDDAAEALRDVMVDCPDMDLYVTSLKVTYSPEDVRPDLPLKPHPVMDGYDYCGLYMVSPIQRYLIRRSLIEDNHLRFIPGILHEDHPFGLELVSCARTVKVLSRSVYNLRMRPGSIMHSITARNSYDLVTGHRHLMTFCEQHIPVERQSLFRMVAYEALYSAYGHLIDLMHSLEYQEFKEKEGDYIKTEIRKVLPAARLRERWKMMAVMHCPRFYFLHVLPLWLTLTRPYSRMIWFLRCRNILK